MTTTKEKPTAQKAFEILCKQIKEKPAAQKPIMAHLRAVTGSNSPLPLYHKTFCPECKDTEHCERCGNERIELYRVMVTAIVRNDFSILQGQVGAGDKRVDPIEATVRKAPVITVEKKEAVTQATTPQSPPEPTKGTEVAPVAPVVKSADPDEFKNWGPKNPTHPILSLEELFRELIRDEVGNAHEATIKRIVESQIKPLTEAVRSLEDTIAELVNAETAKSIAEDAVKHAMSNGGFPEDRVRSVVRDVLKATFTA